MRFLFCTVLVACLALSASALCPAPVDPAQTQGFQYANKGQVCDGVNPLAPLDPSLPITDPERGCSSCCKNFQSCLPSNVSSFQDNYFTCLEMSQNMTCDPAAYPGINPCGPGMTCMTISENDHRCFFPGHLENDAVCLVDEQCQSNNCAAPATRAFNTSGMSLCAPPAGATPTTCLRQSDCPAQTWCFTSNNTCLPSIKVNGDCSAIADEYELIMDEANFVCAPGSACVSNPTAKTGPTYTCVNYYTQNKGSPVCYRDAWWNCQFGFYCNTSDTNSSAWAQGTCLVTNQAGAIGDKCKNFPLTSGGQQECYWGTGCSCFTNNNSTSQGQCSRMYNTNCEIQLRNLVSCIQSNKCPHDGAQLLGGNGSPFTASTVVGSCIQIQCSQAHANLIKCQNDINSPNSIVSPAYIPATFPNNDYSNGSSGLQGWEIGLIIVGIAVAIIIIVVIVVAIVRRKSNTAYQPLE